MSREKIIQKALQKYALHPVYLDSETTGLAVSDEIVDICILDTGGSVLVDTLVRPTRAIPPDATRIHGISNAMVAGAPSWDELWAQIHPILETRHVGIYNADYDTRMILQSNRAHGISWKFPRGQTFCIMKMYAEFFGEFNQQRGSYRWQKLENAGRQCNIPLPNTHRAKADTLLARAVLHHMAGKPG